MSPGDDANVSGIGGYVHLTNNFILKMKNDCYNNHEIPSYYIIGIDAKSYNHVYLRITRSSHAEGQR